MKINLDRYFRNTCKIFFKKFCANPNICFYSPADYWAFDKCRNTMNELGIEFRPKPDLIPGRFHLACQRFPDDYAAFDLEKLTAQDDVQYKLHELEPYLKQTWSYKPE